MKRTLSLICYFTMSVSAISLHSGERPAKGASAGGSSSASSRTTYLNMTDGIKEITRKIHRTTPFRDSLPLAELPDSSESSVKRIRDVVRIVEIQVPKTDDFIKTVIYIPRKEECVATAFIKTAAIKQPVSYFVSHLQETIDTADNGSRKLPASMLAYNSILILCRKAAAQDDTTLQDTLAFAFTVAQVFPETCRDISNKIRTDLLKRCHESTKPALRALIKEVENRVNTALYS